MKSVVQSGSFCNDLQDPKQQPRRRNVNQTPATVAKPTAPAANNQPTPTNADPNAKPPNPTKNEAVQGTQANATAKNHFADRDGTAAPTDPGNGM